MPRRLRSVPKARGHIQGGKSYKPEFCNTRYYSLSEALF